MIFRRQLLYGAPHALIRGVNFAYVTDLAASFALSHGDSVSRLRHVDPDIGSCTMPHGLVLLW
jgi:hypothetical protein